MALAALPDWRREPPDTPASRAFSTDGGVRPLYKASTGVNVIAVKSGDGHPVEHFSPVRPRGWARHGLNPASEH
jgi:hypothetical protein